MHNYHLINLLKNDVNISLISKYDKINNEYLNNNNIRHEDIILPFESIFSSLYRLRFFVKYITSFKDWLISKQMYKVHFKFNSDIIEFMDIHSESYYFLKKKQYKKKTKVIIRSHTPWSLLRKYYFKEEKKNIFEKQVFKRELFCFEECDIITTPSKDLKKELVKLFNLNTNKIVVIPNIIDTEHFKPLNKIKNNNNFTIIHIGRFDRTKGAETLTKAFIELAKEYDNINLINIGKSNYKTILKCKNWLKESSLEYRVNFENFISYESLPRFYQKANVVIAPSEIYESFSYTVAQGMACGKIVIGSNIGGIPETLDYGDAGILFEPGNIQDLILKIKKIYLKQIDIKLIENNARKFILNNFSFNILKSKYLDFYETQSS